MSQPNHTAQLLQQQIDHLQGQVIALRQLILAQAALNRDIDGLRDQGFEHIAAARDSLLAQTVSEATLAGVDLTEEWLAHVTDVR